MVLKILSRVSSFDVNVIVKILCIKLFNSYHSELLTMQGVKLQPIQIIKKLIYLTDGDFLLEDCEYQHDSYTNEKANVMEHHVHLPVAIPVTSTANHFRYLQETHIKSKYLKYALFI